MVGSACVPDEWDTGSVKAYCGCRGSDVGTFDSSAKEIGPSERKGTVLCHVRSHWARADSTRLALYRNVESDTRFSISLNYIAAMMTGGVRAGERELRRTTSLSTVKRDVERAALRADIVGSKSFARIKYSLAGR